MKNKTLKTFTALCLLVVPFAGQAQSKLCLVPEPLSVKCGEGEFVLSSATKINVVSKELQSTAALLETYLDEAYGLSLKEGKARQNVIRLELNPKAPQESYTLSVGLNGVTVRGSKTGVFYATQTLRQLIECNGDRCTLPVVEIEDSPRFGYRGLMLDVGRYFYPVEFIKQFIDVMSQYKLNRFHWSFTQDAGWRIEIKRYPELTRIGAWRRSTNGDYGQQDRIPHGGFYTQKQIREVIAYAAERGVTIIPEINLPGHTMAALAAYPELSCTGGPFAVQHTWGIKDDVLCLGNEAAYEFACNVLEEVFELFPSELIHIGGDEAPRRRWRECPKCNEMAKKVGLNSTDELQSYFVHRLNDFAIAHGKRIMGWDEILDGGLTPGATVMSWRGEAGGIAAAKMGNPVVMAPNIYCYLDYYQSADRDSEPFCIGGFVPLEKCYGYEPYGTLTDEQQQYIVGVQGNIWCEFIHKTEKVWYMGYPRALAIAEIGWSARERRNYDSFRQRLGGALELLDAEGIGFRIPEPLGLDEAVVENGKVKVTLTPPVRGSKIVYTVDGSDPWVRGITYTEPIEVPLSFDGTDIKCIVILDSGRTSAVYTATAKR